MSDLFFGEKTQLTVSNLDSDGVAFDPVTVELLSIGGFEQSVAEIETTVLGPNSLSKTYRPSCMVDNGTLDFQVHFTGNENFADNLGGEDAEKKFVLTVSNYQDSISFTFNGFILSKSYSGMEQENQVLLDISVRISGDVVESTVTSQSHAN